MATAGYGEPGYRQAAPLPSNLVPPMSGNPADQYAPNPTGQGPQVSANLQPPTYMPPTSNVRAFQHPGSNGADPTAGTGSGALKLPTAPAGATLDPNQQYIDAFNASLARQRQAIDSTLAANLQAMGHRRDLAAHTITAGSADVKQALSNQQGTNANELAVARGAGAPDPRVGAGGEENTNLYNTVINAAKSTETGAEPFLQLGAQQNYDQGAAGLNREAMQGRNALDAQQSQFAMQQALQQAGYAHDTAMQQAQFGHQDAAAKAAAQAGDPYYNHALFQSNLTEARGQAHSADSRVAKLSDNIFGSTAELQAYMKQTPQYGWAQRALAKGGGHPNGANGPTYDKQQVLDHIQDQRVIAALIANGLLTAADGKAWTQKQSGGGSGL